jgi:tape measure domain-containing protein
MATDLETLVVRLEAQMRGYEREMQRARTTTDRQTKAIEGRFKGLNVNIGKAMNTLGNAVRGALAGVSLQQVAQFSDSFTRAQNALRVTGLEGEKLQATFTQIAAIAERTSSPIESMAELYGKTALAQKELGATSAEMLAVTEQVGQALLVQGTSGAQAAGAIQQFGQLLASGKVESEEFGSVLDGLFPIAQAVANGMEEAGGSVAKLRALIKDGKVSSEAFFRALQAGSDGLAQQAASSVRTYGQEWTRVENALTLAAGAMGKLTDASGGVGRFVDALVNDIAKVPDGLKSTVDEIERIIALFDRLAAAIPKFEDLRSASQQGLTAVDPDRMARPTETPLSMTVKPKRTISLANYAVPGDDKEKKGRKERESEYAREIAQIKERTEAIRQEATTVGQSEGEIAKARAAFELLRAAKESNVTVDAALRANIDAVAAAYGQAVTELETAENAIRDAQEAMSEFQDIAADGVKGFVSDLMDGVSAAEALQNALKRVGDRLLDMALDAALKGAFGGTNGAGGIGSLFSSLFSGARASGGSVQSGGTYLVGENGPEILRMGRNGMIKPNSALGKGTTGSGMQVVINNNNGSQVATQQTQGPQGPRLEVQIDEMVAGALARGAKTGDVLKNLQRNRMGGR